MECCARMVECVARAIRVIGLGFSRKPVKVLFLGLDNAGKTTLMYAIKGTRGFHTPTTSLNIEEFKIRSRSVLSYDLGGHERVRDVWKDYLVAAGCVIFVVDASDTERFADAKAELDALLSDEDLWGVPFVVFGNKCDVECSVSESDLRDALGLAYRQSRPIDLFMCSAINRCGYNEGLGWVAGFF